MGVELLTERERECLRLLLHPMRAKDIARTTGLSVYTVHDHLKSARRKLKATDSLSAAYILRDHEADPPKNSGATELGWRAADARLHEDAAEVETSGSTIRPFAPRGRPWNDLNLRWRIVWPLLLLGLIALGAGALVAGASALTQLVLTLAG